MVIGIGRGQRSIEIDLLESMIGNNVDGLILISPRLVDSKLEEYARQVPLVVIGHHEPDAACFDTVNGDDRLGGQLAAKELINTGIQNIRMLSLNAHVDSEFDVFHERERNRNRQ